VRPGRPRSAEADDAILDAAMELFAEHGYDALSVEGVAAHAGVAKTTIYRRYPTKLELVMAAIHCAKGGMVPTPDTGSLRADLVEIARGYAVMLTDSEIGRAIPMTLAAKARNPELADAHQALVSARRELTYDVVRRGIRRGELPVGTDPVLVTDMITGALFMRTFVTGDPVDDAFLEALVDRALTAP
jgi:AcrR family transcriptional regulator